MTLQPAGCGVAHGEVQERGPKKLGKFLRDGCGDQRSATQLNNLVEFACGIPEEELVFFGQFPVHNRGKVETIAVETLRGPLDDDTASPPTLSHLAICAKTFARTPHEAGFTTANEPIDTSGKEASARVVGGSNTCSSLTGC